MDSKVNLENIEFKDKTQITKSQWKNILQNKEITTELDLKTVLTVFNSPQSMLTATEIAAILGERSYHVISSGNTGFSRRICAYLNIKPPKNNKGGNRWWTIPYWGKSKGDGKWFYILRPELKEAIEELISEGKLNLNDIVDSVLETKGSLIAEEIPEENANKLFEGTKKQITVNAYERNSLARAKCIEHYRKLNNGKIVCQICDFDFGAFYGEELEGKIHVHHLKPLHEIGEDYEVDAIKDLIPICPNCHLVIHSKEPAYTPQEIKNMLRNKN